MCRSCIYFLLAYIAFAIKGRLSFGSPLLPGLTRFSFLVEWQVKTIREDCSLLKGREKKVYWLRESLVIYPSIFVIVADFPFISYQVASHGHHSKYNLDLPSTGCSLPAWRLFKNLARSLRKFMVWGYIFWIFWFTPNVGLNRVQARDLNNE